MHKLKFLLSAILIGLFGFFETAATALAWYDIGDNGLSRGFWSESNQQYIHDRDVLRNLRQVPRYYRSTDIDYYNNLRQIPRGDYSYRDYDNTCEIKCESSSRKCKNNKVICGERNSRTQSNSEFLNRYLQDYSDPIHDYYSYPY